MAESGRPSGDEKAGGRRAEKKRETLRRITEAGMKLFIENGFEATTLDAIAAAAGISRRTFFYYFKSKDDILLSLYTSGIEDVIAALMEEPSTLAPVDAVCNALVKVCNTYPQDQLMVIDRLMMSSKAIQAGKQAGYIQQERALSDALQWRWPDPERRAGLRLVALLSVGAMRLSMDAWREEGGKRPVSELITEQFDALKSEI